MVKLSVVIATYNRAENLLRTLNSLLAQDLDRSLWEVVVVNNNSKDNTEQAGAAFAASHPEVAFKMVLETAQGLSHARNRGLKESTGEYIVIIDDDEEVVVDFLSAYYDFFEAHPDVVAAGGEVVPLYEFAVPRWLSPYSERPIAGTLNLGREITLFRGEAYPAGGNMGFRRAAFEKYGAFNPELGRTGNSLLGGEEKDLFQRFRQGGEKMYYLPRAVMYHIIPESRMNTTYLYKVSAMIGRSERLRTMNLGTAAYAKRLFAECVKWGGTMVLLGAYTLKCRPSAGWVLVRMRLEITKGLFRRA